MVRCESEVDRIVTAARRRWNPLQAGDQHDAAAELLTDRRAPDMPAL